MHIPMGIFHLFQISSIPCKVRFVFSVPLCTNGTFYSMNSISLKCMRNVFTKTWVSSAQTFFHLYKIHIQFEIPQRHKVQSNSDGGGCKFLLKPPSRLSCHTSTICPYSSRRQAWQARIDLVIFHPVDPNSELVLNKRIESRHGEIIGNVRVVFMFLWCQKRPSDAAVCRQLHAIEQQKTEIKMKEIRSQDTKSWPLYQHE